ncbi:hypothetical protein Zm00014a_014791 [Zea mays]|uniref:GST N-terminal domain-containing protein n=1 Tax=Zea mays TaxID=4577 RepID=A0A3L6EQU8_MAIZE|nr:hypothetical protein Zm00014a_014791 [Zea mays]
MAGADDLKVLGMWTSPFVIRVCIVLNLKGLAYEYVEEDLGNKSPAPAQLQPGAQDRARAAPRGLPRKQVPDHPAVHRQGLGRDRAGRAIARPLRARGRAVLAGRIGITSHGEGGFSSAFVRVCPHGTEDEAPRKKARLGWGQGLTKYEKQKVQGPVDPAEAVVDGSPADGELKTASLVPMPAPYVAPAPPAAPVLAPAPAPAPSAAPAFLSAPMQCSSPVTGPPYCSSGGYYRQGGGAYDRSYPDDPQPIYKPSRSDRYWPKDDGGGYKGFVREGGFSSAFVRVCPHGTEDEAPRKKARLGWGQGLTKYEKQKVQGPVDPAEAVVDGSPADGELKTASLVPMPAPYVAPAPPAAPVLAPAPAPAPSAAPAFLSAPMQCSSPVTGPPYCSSVDSGPVEDGMK